jgi:hypothetical protein
MKTGLSLHAVALAAVVVPLAGTPAHAVDQAAWLQEQLKVTDGYEPASRQPYTSGGERAAASANRDGSSAASVTAKAAGAPDSGSRSK